MKADHPNTGAIFHTNPQSEETERARATKARAGLRGLLDRLTGKRKQMEEHNRQQAAQALKRDQNEQAALQQEKAAILNRAERRAAFVEQRRQSNIEELRQDRQTLTPAFTSEAAPKNAVNREAFKKTLTSTKERPRRRSCTRAAQDFPGYENP